MEAAEARGYDLPSDDDDSWPSESAMKREDREDPPGTPEKRILEDILKRVRRIEEQLEKGRLQVPEPPERPSLEDMFSELIAVLRRMERSSDEISDLRERMRRVERRIDRPLPGGVDSQPIVPVVTEDRPKPLPTTDMPQLLKQPPAPEYRTVHTPERWEPRSTISDPRGRLESIPEVETNPPEEPHGSDDRTGNLENGSR